MAQPIGRFDSSGVSAILRNVDRRPTPPRRLQSQDTSVKLAELEDKMREQERFNSFLVDQINKIEGNMSKMYSRRPSAGRGDDRIQKLEEDLKRLELNLGRDNKDLKAFQQDSELTQMRTFIQEKITEDFKLHQKHKEKGQVLFGEVVRLGENYEKTTDFLQNLSVSLESRMMSLENRINSGERQVVSVDNKSEGSVSLLIELAEKVDRRMQMIETALLAVGGESEKNFKAIDRVESGAYRLQEDLKAFFKQLQSDIQQRLEIKSGDLFNKLLQEQEERLRNHEDLKYTFELKDKMIQEKLQYDRNEFKTRISSVESYVKTELQRKEDMIQNLSSNFDNQIRNIVDTIRTNEAMRQEREEHLSEEMAHAVEINRQSIEQHKSFQSSITEKVTEMVRTEIETRQKGEKDFKNIIQSTMKGILQEISVQKDVIDRLKLKFDHDIHEAQSSFSEKADILSRYIDEETARTSELMKSQHMQVKDMITKLTESLKTTIISNEKWKSEIIKRFGKVDQRMQAFTTDLNASIETNESRLFLKLRELQKNLEEHLAGNMKILETRIETLAAMVDTSLGNFETSLFQNREVFVDIVNKLNLEISEQHGIVCKDMQKLLSEVQSSQSEIDSVADLLNERLQDMVKKIAIIESETLVLFSSEKLIRESMINRVSEDVDEQIKELEEKVGTCEERLSEEEKIQQGNDDRNLEKFNEIVGKLKKVSELAKGSQTGIVLENEEKERNELFRDSQAVIDNLLLRVEAGNSAHEFHQIVQKLQHSENEIASLKEMLNAEVEKLHTAHGKVSEESRMLIEEIFDKKVSGIQEKIKRDNEKLWNSTVNHVKNPELPRKDEMSELNERLTSIATTEREQFKPKLRF